MKLSADRTQITADGQDLSFITVELVDNNGIRSPKAENLLKFGIDGIGTIVGVANANPVSLESYQQPQRKAWHGKSLVIIKAENHPGEIHLKVTSTGLNTSEMTINSVAF